jgi:hypothetical protein
MKSTALLRAALLVAALTGLTALAQEMTTAPAPAASAPAAPAGPKVDGLVYVAQLPTPAQLIKEASAEGITVSRLEQTAERILVTYQYANGTTRTYAYLPLAADGTVPAGTPAVVASATPPVVYAEPDRVYYYPRYVRYYDPGWDFWAPLAVGVGLGWGFGGHGGYHGGYHGGGHGGWRH